MDDPIKVIWRYKNNHRRLQYHIYIYVGNVPPDILKILNKMAELNLYNTLISLTKAEFRRIEEFYGDKWYKKLFNMYHINYTINLVKESTAQRRELTEKLGDDWVSEHIDKHELMERKLLYSYEALIKDERSRKSMKKGRTVAIVEDETDLDYTTHPKDDLSKIFDIKTKNKRQDYNTESLSRTAQLNQLSQLTTSETSDDLSDLTVPQNEDVYEVPLTNISKENIKKEIPFVDARKMNEFNRNIDDYVNESETSIVDINSELYDEEQQTGGHICNGCDKIFECPKCGNQFECHNKKQTINRTQKAGYYHKCKGPGCDYLYKCLDCENNHRFHENDQEQYKNISGGQIDEPEDITFDEGEDIDIETLSDEELDMQEIEKLYKEVDVEPDEHIETTSDLIKKALNDEKLFEKKILSIIEFDTSKDNNMYDENLKDVFEKIYVTEQYIFKDDTVKTVKDKICCSIKNNSKFDKDSYIIPSRQYLWAEYYFNNKIERIMIGQKWIRRNELLNIDVDPNPNIRYYEELRGNLKTLRDNIRRYGNKIRREDDDNNILFDYENYIMGNDLYMIDIYNELGLGYNPNAETLKNIADIYIRLYFPKIKTEDIKHIIDYLNNEKKIETNKMTTTFDTINNDLVMNNEIMNVVESVKITDDYKKIFRDNYITQSVIHVNLRIIEGKIDLYRIFNEFESTDIYPFLQYQTPDGTIFFKFKEQEIANYLKKKENAEVLSKWFENSPYGISFKVKISEKDGDRFTAINLNENGRIEYKTQWKEEDMATISDIKNTYNYVKDLIKKINSERNKVIIDIPDDNEFKYAFINTIQKFELPEDYVINHNDLSEFSRYFYPYVALVIEPRKRQAKVQKGIEKSKFGTYLRYKRVSKYENQQRLEQRIMYFMRNYEYNDQSLANEISKQFNITEERAMNEIEKVRQRYPNIKRSRKFLKKLENIPKYKPPGIGIDVQGKQREKYKIRISGARDKQQLDRIITFMNILIHLYIETYIYKRPERQILKEKLKKLNNIARRRNKVDEIVYYNKEIKTVKQMTQIDKRRIGFKPEKGQNQWTRSCQNSGTDKKRRPQQFSSINMDELIKNGYALNKKTGAFERRIILKKKNGKKQEITLRTIKLKEFDENGNPTGNDIHYACSPEENGDHIYIGFLTRSSNPHGYCMPCCFKKDPTTSKNKEKREFFLRCLGQSEEEVMGEKKITQKAVGDKLYILQDTNKIQEGRFSFLPKYLDFFFNIMLEKQKKIKHHYLIKTETGYFFKYGSRQDEYQFLNAIGSILDMTVNEIKQKIITALEKDKNDLLFISLNNGDIKTQFNTRQHYIDFIKYNNYLDFDVMNSILSLPGVVDRYGLNILVFQKRTFVIKRALEKEKFKDDFFLLCQNIEDKYSITDQNKKTLFLLKENRNYYPIVMVFKDNENTKNITVLKTFVWEDKEKNIVNHVKDFYERNCYGSYLDEIVYKNTSLTARETYHILNKLNDKDYLPKYQVIDVRNKCKYIITNGNLIVTVRPSGSIYNLQTIKNVDKYIDNFDSTFIKLKNLYEKSNKQLPVKPKGVYFDEKRDDKYKITAIVTKSNGNVPVIPEFIELSVLENRKLIIEDKPLYDKIDKEIEKGKENYIIDERIKQVNYDKYYNESYELFRLEFSDYINNEENIALKSKLQEILIDDTIEKDNKIHKIRLFLYKLIDKDLYDQYKKIVSQNIQNVIARNTMIKDIEETITDNTTQQREISEPLEENRLTEDLNENFPNTPIIEPDVYNTKLNSLSLTTKLNDFPKNINATVTGDVTRSLDAQIGGKYNKFVHITNKIPNLTKYQINNDRNICPSFTNKDQCQLNPHCNWAYSKCYLSLTTDMIITFVNKISEELASGDLKALEILKVENYFVSDIVDYNKFTERPGQKIIRSSSNTIKKVLNDLFGRDNVPKIGRRRATKGLEVNYQQMNVDNPIRDMRDIYVQNIIDNNLSIFRAYVNGYYWLKHPYYDIDSRNLGFYSPLQTELSNYFRSLVIDWLQDNKYRNLIEDELVQFMDQRKSSKNPINDFIIKLGSDVYTLSNCIVELYALNKLQRIPIIVYDDNNTVIYIFDGGLKYHHRYKKTMSKQQIEDYIKNTDSKIQIRFSFITQNTIPDEIEVIYSKE